MCTVTRHESVLKSVRNFFLSIGCAYTAFKVTLLGIRSLFNAFTILITAEFNKERKKERKIEKRKEKSFIIATTAYIICYRIL
jgi:hypothetical protein